MIIAIDGNEANRERRVGIGEYSFELLKQFELSNISDLEFHIYLKDSPLPHMPSVRKGWSYRVFGPKRLWTQIALPYDLYTHFPRPEVFFTPSHYAPRFSPVPTVISVMDLSYIHFSSLFKKSDLYQLQNWTRYSIQQARKVLTISQSSKNDIIKIYGISENKVKVTYLGIKPESENMNQLLSLEELKTKYQISDSYILFVGTLQPRKNIEKLIEAFSRLDTKLELVIIGKKGWLFEKILQAPKRLGIENKVKFLDFVPDSDLPSFYRNAKLFVFPSLYEGFGLPVLEAMKYECPVITSNISSLPEAAGDAALYVDPNNVEDIAEKIQKLLSDKNLRQNLIRKGKKQITKFSWEKTAKETLDILRNVAQN